MSNATENMAELHEALRQITDLRLSRAWLVAQMEAFQAAIGGASLSDSLGILARTATELTEGDVRCGFWIVNRSTGTLHPLVGLSEEYAQRVKSKSNNRPPEVGAGLSVITGEPVIASDVREDPSWQSLLELAEEFDIRAIWSFPVITTAGRPAGAFSMYFREPRRPTPEDLASAGVMTHAAAIIISHHEEAQERLRTEERRELLVAELNHRVKNTLATVQSIAAQTLRNAGDLTQGHRALSGRLVALSKSHDVLVREHMEGADLRELITSALIVFADDAHERRFFIAGPDIRLRPQAALALALAFHELATNAIKYGALSNAEGQVALNWRVVDAPAHFELTWRESGGPPVVIPLRQGFGTRLIRRGLASDLGGEVRLEFDREGVVCRVRAPVEEIEARQAPIW